MCSFVAGADQRRFPRKGDLGSSRYLRRESQRSRLRRRSNCGTGLICGQGRPQTPPSKRRVALGLNSSFDRLEYFGYSEPNIRRCRIPCAPRTSRSSGSLKRASTPASSHSDNSSPAAAPFRRLLLSWYACSRGERHCYYGSNPDHSARHWFGCSGGSLGCQRLSGCLGRMHHLGRQDIRSCRRP